MNRELAIVLRDSLMTLPFADLLAGLAVTRQFFDQGENGKLIRKEPVSADVIGYDCTATPEISMVPDSSRKSVIYFEDNGITKSISTHQYDYWVSNLRLVCWLNKAKFAGDTYAKVVGSCELAVISALQSRNPLNAAGFIALVVEPVRILPADVTIFSGKYTYREEINQYLTHPYDFFAVDLRMSFRTRANCWPKSILQPAVCQ